MPLVFLKSFRKLPPMWKSMAAGGLISASAFAQSPQIEIANLREDVRGLTQRVTELTLRLEQIERENTEWRRRATAADKNYATMAEVKEAVEEMARTARSAVSTSKAEVLQQVAAGMEKLAKQTNAALESVAKSPATRTAVQTIFAEDYAKEGMSYTVQKGDSLASIAKKTGAKQHDIINANKISDPSRITTGQTLFIPAGK
jgi:nucleoid-associated protein YgaU